MRIRVKTAAGRKIEMREEEGREGRVERREANGTSDLFDWCTSVLSLGPAHFLALFLLRIRLVDPFVRPPYTFGPFTPH